MMKIWNVKCHRKWVNSTGQVKSKGLNFAYANFLVDFGSVLIKNFPLRQRKKKN